MGSVPVVDTAITLKNRRNSRKPAVFEKWHKFTKRGEWLAWLRHQLWIRRCPVQITLSAQPGSETQPYYKPHTGQTKINQNDEHWVSDIVPPKEAQSWPRGSQKADELKFSKLSQTSLDFNTLCNAVFVTQMNFHYQQLLH